MTNGHWNWKFTSLAYQMAMSGIHHARVAEQSGVTWTTYDSWDAHPHCCSHHPRQQGYLNWVFGNHLPKDIEWVSVRKNIGQTVRWKGMATIFGQNPHEILMFGWWKSPWKVIQSLLMINIPMKSGNTPTLATFTRPSRGPTAGFRPQTLHWSLIHSLGKPRAADFDEFKNQYLALLKRIIWVLNT